MREAAVLGTTLLGLLMAATLKVYADDTEIFSSIDRRSFSSKNESARPDCNASVEMTLTNPSIAAGQNETPAMRDAYISTFIPNHHLRWSGRIFKLQLRDGRLVGADSGGSSINAMTIIEEKSDAFATGAKDFWDHAINLNSSDKAQIDRPGVRVVYTYLSSDTHPSSPQPLSNNQFSEDSLDIAQNLSSDRSVVERVLKRPIHERGADESSSKGAARDYGPSIHSQPALVRYGNSETVLYRVSNSGFLQAIDGESGRELWSYVPQELLGKLKDLVVNPESPAPQYLLDGNIRLLVYDVNGDGLVQASDNDRVFLYFSQGRGGEHYYALDVTEKEKPKFLWSLDNSDLGGIVTKSWSTPSVGHILVGDGKNQNTQKLVLVFAGGYDDLEDSLSYKSPSDQHGNGLFMVDAVNGTMLWHQSKTKTGALSNLTHAIPSNVTLLDTNGDGWTDRIYVGDIAGQIWRFDIFNGQSGSESIGDESSSIVTGGVIASLGGKNSPLDENNRHFFNAPDVARINVRSSSSYYNIAIGSGDRSFPKSNVVTQDRFYSIRDYHLEPMSQAAYNELVPITDAGPNGLVTITGSGPTTLPNGVAGWKLNLLRSEKVLSESVTANGVTMFATFTPADLKKITCPQFAGLARAYAVVLSTGLKQFDTLFESFPTTTLPALSVIFPESPASEQPNATYTNGRKKGICLLGTRSLKNCIDLSKRTPTYWRQEVDKY